MFLEAAELYRNTPKQYLLLAEHLASRTFVFMLKNLADLWVTFKFFPLTL
jgi:hypothetical protein